MGQATAMHHHVIHTPHLACHARMLRTYKHACMGAICSHATFLLGRHWQQIFNEYQRTTFMKSCATQRLGLRLPHTPHHIPARERDHAVLTCFRQPTTKPP